MTLYHTTPSRNLHSIFQRGLRLHNGVVWLHTKATTRWARVHLARHHKCEVDDMDTVTVSVRRDLLRRVGGLVPGRFICFSNIPPSAIGAIL